MRSYMGLRPMPRSRGAVSMGLRAPQWIRYSGAPRPALRHERRELYMGLRPMPHSRTFLPKSPRGPKKPNRARYILSNIDSEQGCRRQPCFFVWRRQHGTATAPLPHSSAVRPHPPHRPRPLAHPPPTVSPTPPHLLVFTPPAPACLPADALKRQSFSFLQSISNFIVSLQNVSEKT